MCERDEVIKKYKEKLEETAQCLDWMVRSMKIKHDATGIAVGDYSPELLVAIRLERELKEMGFGVKKENKATGQEEDEKR